MLFETLLNAKFRSDCAIKVEVFKIAFVKSALSFSNAANNALSNFGAKYGLINLMNSGSL
jgi:hypothetical protein